MRQENGTDLLGANDPRGATIGVIYVSASDDRKSVLAAILTQEKLGREQIAVVLPPNQQNKAFQRPGDFDDLKAMRRRLKALIVFIAPSGPGPAELARQRRFPVYSSTESYANALREQAQLEGASKKSWLFGSPGAKPESAPTPSSFGAPNRRNTRLGPTQPLPAPAPRSAQRAFDEDEHGRGNAAPFVAGAAGAAVGGAAAMAYEHTLDHGSTHTNYDDPATPSGYGSASNSAHGFEDDEELGPPSTPMPVPADSSGSTQAIPLARSAAPVPEIDDSPVIELRSRRPSPRPTLPLTPQEPDSVPETPVPQPPRQSRASRQLPVAPVAAAAVGGALAGAAAVSAATPARAATASAAAPARNPAPQGRTVAASGAGIGTLASRPGRVGGQPPRSVPPKRGGRGGGGGRPANRRILLIVGTIILLLALLSCGGYMALAQKTSPVGHALSTALGLSSSGTVSITPASKPVTNTYTLAGADTTDATARTVATRAIAGTAQSAPVTVNATGHNVKPATEARGFLKFFNSLPVARQLNAGQVVNAGGGVTIVLDETAFMGASNGVINGSATVAAHATPAGPGGNIGAMTFNVSQCCAANITVTNLAAFTGGQNPVDYKFLKPADATSAVTQQIKDTVKQDAVNNLSKQLHSGEQVLSTPQCAPIIGADQQVGDNGPANPVTGANIIYRMKCTATSYDYSGAQLIVSGLLAQQAATTLPRGYTPVSNIQVSLNNQTTANNKTSFFFSGKGLWAYQFSDQQKLNIAKSIAGKSVAEAQTILKNTPGVGDATVTTSGGNLPSDPNQLSIQVQSLTGSTTAAPVATPTISPPNIAAPVVQGGVGSGGK